MYRVGTSGSHCRNPSRGGSTRFGKPEAPVKCISRTILYAALSVSAALKQFFRSWPQKGHRLGRSMRSRTTSHTLCVRLTNATGVCSRARRSHSTKRCSPSLSRTRGRSCKARQDGRWSSVFRSALWKINSISFCITKLCGNAVTSTSVCRWSKNSGKVS